MPLTNRCVTENWRSERTCNGNETQQESLLPSSGLQRTLSSRRPSPSPPAKTDSVEMETIMVPVASYDSASDVVRLKLIAEEEPPPYEKLSTAE